MKCGMVDQNLYFPKYSMTDFLAKLGFVPGTRGFLVPGCKGLSVSAKIKTKEPAISLPASILAIFFNYSCSKE